MISAPEPQSAILEPARRPVMRAAMLDLRPVLAPYPALYLDRADREALEHPFLTLAIRLQFAFAARMSEIISLEWKWVDLAERRVIWPDSKTGEISKPMSKDAFLLLLNARVCNRPPTSCHPSWTLSDRSRSILTGKVGAGFLSGPRSLMLALMASVIVRRPRSRTRACP